MTVSPMDLARQDLARAVGVSATVYGYPLIESMRTCCLQTQGEALRAPINTVHHIRHPSTDRDRDVVTPANDLLYTTAWINLADGPVRLTVPSAQRHAGRYFVLALYDAYTENFDNVGPRNSAAAGETVVLVGPDGLGEHAGDVAGQRVIACPTHLVWLIGRIVAGDEADWPAAQALQAEIRLEGLRGAASRRAPQAVAQWSGPPVDVMAQVVEQGADPAAVAPVFYRHLALALEDAPGRVQDQGMVAWLSQNGLRLGEAFDWAALDEPVRRGLTEGFAQALHLIGVSARSRSARPWALASRAGRYGSDYLMRALTAYIGLGALATDEAIYGAGHFDVARQPLDGARSYRMRFAADGLPPADAFWSVTLYDAQDRFLYGNSLGRHSIGDRTPGLRYEPDGALQIDFSHEPPRDTRNWLPTPPGRFYLIVRIYHPREALHSWQVPALEPVEAA
ncbi:hypothetical protein CCO03_05910 [Comamonas serinivorans]|uniref:Phosphatidylserine decarboxylase n=1 Tax=Comamonas serinivorans TaxID=1082851 RepID=A0A1Y0EKX0_9BURK|nr:DUF1254 domain-containing protein [Comamonas serinivorans]ARU04274.1 hypothetical protein CCO03_05910 [Comamonas serinivorans]